MKLKLTLRFFDLLFSFIGLIFLSPLVVLIVLVSFTQTNLPFFKQVRMGKNKKPFNLFKFRSMNVGTNSVASHLVNYNSITPLGRILRKYKLDEIPQLWNVLIGDMSLVGPRPILFNQIELIEDRDILNIYEVKPGITGLSQIRKIDMSTPKILAETDLEMIERLTIIFYFYIIFQTILGKGAGDGVTKSF